MRTRKPHSKSRFGCLPCKQRRIKCGEEAPSCRNCTQRGVQCSYGLARASGTEVAPQSATSELSYSTVCAQIDNAQCTPPCNSGSDAGPTLGPRLRESRIMVHYMTTTCATLSHGEEDITIWKELVPEEATQHDFLMDGLLALASLHLAWQNPTSKWEYTAAAIQYQDSALRNYRTALEAITDDNRHALFASSIIITILALAFSVTCPDPPNASPYARIASVVELLQGIGFVNQAVGPSIHQGKYRGLFQPHFSREQSRLSKDLACSLSDLRELACGTNGSLENDIHQAYISGIDSLHEAFSCMEGSTHLGPVLAWPTSVSRELLRLFKQGDPMAETIFMYYGVLLLHAQERWWAKDLGLRVVNDLANSVCVEGPQWAAVAQRAQDTAALAVRRQ
ncbi:hypothetical protein DE146DRAFT_731459 [Phaeosphaeria sp. MPI-PUGE-AT-0046c]|nr:hypothetical protein DE146DRAFT_731459 [Phaeosphaeria sp. MPI-PUGE-AT-0046c]